MHKNISFGLPCCLVLKRLQRQYLTVLRTQTFQVSISCPPLQIAYIYSCSSCYMTAVLSRQSWSGLCSSLTCTGLCSIVISSRMLPCLWYCPINLSSKMIFCTQMCSSCKLAVQGVRATSRYSATLWCLLLNWRTANKCISTCPIFKVTS